MILTFWDLDDQEGRKKNLLDIMLWVTVTQMISQEEKEEERVQMTGMLLIVAVVRVVTITNLPQGPCPGREVEETCGPHHRGEADRPPVI